MSRYSVYEKQPCSCVTSGIVMVPVQALPLAFDVIAKVPSEEM